MVEMQSNGDWNGSSIVKLEARDGLPKTLLAAHSCLLYHGFLSKFRHRFCAPKDFSVIASVEAA